MRIAGAVQGQGFDTRGDHDRKGTGPGMVYTQSLETYVHFLSSTSLPPRAGTASGLAGYVAPGVGRRCRPRWKTCPSARSGRRSAGVGQFGVEGAGKAVKPCHTGRAWHCLLARRHKTEIRGTARSAGESAVRMRCEPSLRLSTATCRPAQPARLTRTPATFAPQGRLLCGVRVSRATQAARDGRGLSRFLSTRPRLGGSSCSVDHSSELM
jgi:hypothetical protein